MSKQAFYQMLEAADIKSGLIERIAALYNRPIGFFFDEKQNINESAVSGNGGQSATGFSHINIGTNQAEHDELIRLRVEAKMLQERLAEAQKAYETLYKSYEHLQKMNEYLMGQNEK